MPIAIFDLDGVIVQGARLLPGANEALDAARSRGWRVILATNNSTRTRADLLRELRAQGLARWIDDLVTSASATASYLADRSQRADIFVVGTDGLRDELLAAGLRPRPELAEPSLAQSGLSGRLALLAELEAGPIPEAVVVGLDPTFTYARLARAQHAVLQGAEFIATNRDASFPMERRVLPGAGPIVAAIERATGREAVCVGKPESRLFEGAIRLGGGRHDGPVVVFGDSPSSDIVAAHRAGAIAVLVKTGLAEGLDETGLAGDAVPDRTIASLAMIASLPELA